MIPVNVPLLGGNEKKYVLEALDTGWISSEGPFIKKFEEGMAKICNRKHGVAVANGSVALDLALHVLELQPGDEVIMPTFTIISCITAILRVGAVPVLVDSDVNTWNMDVHQVEQKITKKTKAIMVVHIYGLPVEMNPILDLAKKYNLKIIEDAAEMHGQNYFDQPCGSFGDISTFSFYANKQITTGEGGMVMANDDHLAERCRFFRNLGFEPKRRFVHDELGWNFRMTNLQAALGAAQVERIDEIVARKRKIGNKYQQMLAGMKTQFQLPLAETEYAKNIYWVFGLVLSDVVKMNAFEAMKKFTDRGIGVRPFFWCMHEQPVLLKMGLFKNESYPVAERLARRGFYLPSGLGLTDDQQQTVVQVVKEVLS